VRPAAKAKDTSLGTYKISIIFTKNMDEYPHIVVLIGGRAVGDVGGDLRKDSKSPPPCRLTLQTKQ
jgi:hypothetical protein